MGLALSMGVPGVVDAGGLPSVRVSPVPWMPPAMNSPFLTVLLGVEDLVTPVPQLRNVFV